MLLLYTFFNARPKLHNSYNGMRYCKDRWLQCEFFPSSCPLIPPSFKYTTLSPRCASKKRKIPASYSAKSRFLNWLTQNLCTTANYANGCIESFTPTKASRQLQLAQNCTSCLVSLFSIHSKLCLLVRKNVLLNHRWFSCSCFPHLTTLNTLFPHIGMLATSFHFVPVKKICLKQIFSFLDFLPFTKP